jgi:hypothetical protein
MTALSDAGEAEYKAIQKRHGITTSSTVEEYKACLLEMWTVADEWQAQLTKATDGELPGELFPQEEVTNA